MSTMIFFRTALATTPQNAVLVLIGALAAIAAVRLLDLPSLRRIIAFFDIMPAGEPIPFTCTLE